MPFTLHPAVHAALAARMGPNPPAPPPVGDWKTRRAQLDIAFSGLSQNQPLVSDVSTQDFTTVSADNHPLTLRWFSKSHTTTTNPGSAILYAHGGGMIALGLKHYDQIIKRYVSRTSVPFLLVDYRLAPEVRAPVPVTDVFAGLVWLHSHAPELGVDPNRIGIMGDSAGGGITASLAHYLTFHGPAAGLPPVAKQILIYPMLDDRTTLTTTSSNHEELTPFLTWTLSDNTTGWTCLLGVDRVNTPQITVLEAPGRMTIEEAKNLPPTYIDVGELDLFRAEDIEYAQTLGKAGVSVELHVIPRAPHAFESFAPDADISRFVMECRERVMKSI